MLQSHCSILLAVYLLCLAYKLHHTVGVATMREACWTCIAQEQQQNMACSQHLIVSKLNVMYQIVWECCHTNNIYRHAYK